MLMTAVIILTLPLHCKWCSFIH